MKIIIIILFFTILMSIYFLFKKEHFQVNDIDCYNVFSPRGQTRELCVNECLSNNQCSRVICEDICDRCTSDNCLWMKSENQRINKLKPDPIRVKVFSGNECLKITWIRPYSEFDITKYYIIISSKAHSTRPLFLDVYSVETSNNLIEYYIGNLENNVLYSVVVISKNKMGLISDKSNTESVITDENSEIKLNLNESTHDVSDSIQSKQNKFNLMVNQKKIYHKNVVFNDIKDILVNKLKFKEPVGEYKININ